MVFSSNTAGTAGQPHIGKKKNHRPKCKTIKLLEGKIEALGDVRSGGNFLGTT